MNHVKSPLFSSIQSLTARFVLCALVAALSVSSAHAQDYAQIELASPDLQPSIGPWEYVRSGIGEVCRDISFNSPDAVAECVIADAVANQGACSGTHSISAFETIDQSMGYVSQQDAEVTYHLSYNSGPPNNTCEPDSPYVEHISAAREISCDSFSGYSEGQTACVNGSTIEVLGPLPIEDQSGGCSLVGDPCNAATGDVIQNEVDISSPTLQFGRTYHSLAAHSQAGIGIGWSHTFSGHLVVVCCASRPRVWVSPRGDVEPLAEVSGGGTFISTTGSGVKVKPINPGANGTGWYLYQPNGVRETYSPSGQLLKARAANGLETTVNYAPNGRIASVVGPFGHTLVFAFNPEGLIASITDPSGGGVSYTYDTSATSAGFNNLVRVTYQDLSYREYLYTNTGFPHHLTGIRDENNIQFVSWGYDTQGRVVSNALGPSGTVAAITLEYSATPAETRITDSANTETVFSYIGLADPWSWRLSDDPLATTYPSLQAAIAAARVDCGSDCWNVQPTGRVLDYTSATSDSDRFRKLDSADTAGDGRAYVYNQGTSDPARRLDTLTDERGNETKFLYDTYHVTSQTEAFGTADARPTSYFYLENTSDLPVLVTIPSVIGGGNVQAVTTTYVPGTQRVQAVTVSGYDPAQPSTLLERTTGFPTYDAYAKQPTLIQGPRSGIADNTALTYWDESTPGVACSSVGGGACGQLKTLTNAADHLTTFDLYYPDGRLQQMTDPNGMITTYTYDLRGRLDTVTETPTNGTARLTDYDYDAVGQLQKVTLPNGQIQNYVWTTAHLLDYVTDNAGNKIDLSYDSRGNQIGTAQKWPNGGAALVEGQTYDARNHLDTQQLGARPAADLSVGATGLLEGVTDSGGRFTDYSYDPLNRLKQIVDPQNGASAATEYGYDGQDNLTSVETPNGATTSYVYDDLGNLRKEVSPDRGTTLYGYDEAGNMSCRADGRYAGSATTCEVVSNRWVYQYDALNRVTSIDYLSTGDSPDVSFTYDIRPGSGVTQAGRLRQVVATNGTLTVTRQMDYDAWGNVTWSKQTLTEGSATKTYTTQYQYDGNNQLKQITYPSGRVVDYIRYANGRIKKVNATFNGVTTTVVAQVSNQPFGAPYTIGYGNGMVQFREMDTAGAPDYYSLVDATTYLLFDAQDYTLDSAGNITQMLDDVDGASTRNYHYDDLDRLTWDSGASSADPTYTYDGNGNRLTRAAGTYAAQSFTYVNNSNRDVATSYDGMGNSLANSAGYDASGRLASVTDANTGDALALGYNALGELARTTQTHDDGCGPVFLAGDDFSFAPDGRALSIKTTNTASINTDYIWLDDLPVAQFQDTYDAQGNFVATAATYLHPDHLGTPRIGTNSSRQITWRNRSDGFGIPNLSGSAVVRLRFPGQISLGVAGINYNYYRDYQPNTGRYLESDPIGLTGGLNSYRYVGANPLRWTDQLGLTDLLFNPLNGTLTVTDSAGTSQDFPAANNAQRSSRGPWAAGTYDYAYHVAHLDDAPDSAFGSSGNYVFDVPNCRGCGVHSGRRDRLDLAGRRGVDHATNGCIRTTDEATALIGQLISRGDPVRQLIVLPRSPLPPPLVAQPAAPLARRLP
jgi:RHS repeat-associated protein